MEKSMYRLITNLRILYSEDKETYSDYLEYEEALSDYNASISSFTSTERAAKYDIEPYYITKKDHVSNAGGEWHWCNLKNEEGDFYDLRIEPIQPNEAKYFASPEIEAKYNAIYGLSSNPNFFSRIFKRRK